MAIGNGGIIDPNQSGLVTPGYNQPNMLYIFSPRNWGVQAMRPFQWSIAPNKLALIEEAVISDARKVQEIAVSHLTRNADILGDVLLPSTNPTFSLNLNGLGTGEPYTFIFIANNISSNNGTYRLVAGQNNKQIMTGYFIGEPYVFRGYGNPAFNENAMLVVTHKTLFASTPAISAFGTASGLGAPLDRDVVPCQDAQAISTAHLLLSDTHSIFDTSYVNEATGERVNIVSDNTSLAAKENPVSMASDYRSPIRNIRKTLNAVKNGILEATNPLETPEPNANAFSSSAAESLVKMHLADPDQLTSIGPTGEDCLSLTAFIARWDPKVELLDAPASTAYSTLDQRDISQRNAFASLLADMLPGMAMRCGFAGVTFQYVSTQNVFKWWSADEVVDLSEEVKTSRIGLFERDFRQTVVPIIRNVTAGPGNEREFSLDAVVHGIGITRIVLNFLDDAYHTAEAFEKPTLFGGLLNPQVADIETMAKNSGEVTAMMNRILRTDDQSSSSMDIVHPHDQVMFRGAMDHVQPGSHIIKMGQPNQPQTGTGPMIIKMR
jgi:hypothetical protein